MKIDAEDFRVRAGEKVGLDERPTDVRHFFESKERYQELLAMHIEGLSSRQQLHYASGRYAALPTPGRTGSSAHRTYTRGNIGADT